MSVADRIQRQATLLRRVVEARADLERANDEIVAASRRSSTELNEALKRRGEAKERLQQAQERCS